VDDWLSGVGCFGAALDRGRPLIRSTFDGSGVGRHVEACGG
jgi:hypothetical protein